MESTAPEAESFDKPYRLERSSPAEAARLAKRVVAGCEGSEEDTQAACAVLSLAELTVVSGFKAPKRRSDWLAGRLAAKRLMSWCLAQEGRYLKLSEIEILNNPDGAPFVRTPFAAQYSRYPISLSHSAAGGVAAVAHPGHCVGVDLERVELRSPRFLSLMAHDSEWDASMETDPAEQTRLWTLKEAVSKLLEVGLSAGFWDIRFPLSGDARRLELYNKPRRCWEDMGKPVIHFDAVELEGGGNGGAADDVLSIAYTTGDPVHG